MMDDEALDRLEGQFLGLESTLTGIAGVTGAFRRELADAGGSLRETGREAASMSRSVSSSLRRAFEGILLDGKGVGEALRSVGLSLSNAALNRALAPVQSAVASAVGGGIGSVLGGLLPFAKGGVVAAGRVQAFASGVVDRPAVFPMRGGAGLMGEAGPEAILPLARGADGRLGVRSGGGGRPVQVTMNITTPDAEGFRRSRTQIAAELGRAIQRGGRNY